MIILLYRVALLADLAGIAAFILAYTKLAPWWKDPIGRTIVIKDILLFLVMIPTMLSLFLSFNRLTSQIAAWVDLALLGAIGPVMLWRIWVFWKARQR